MPQEPQKFDRSGTNEVSRYSGVVSQITAPKSQIWGRIASGVILQRGSFRKGGQISKKGGVKSQMGSKRKEFLIRERKIDIAKSVFSVDMFFTVCRDRGLITEDMVYHFVKTTLRLKSSQAAMERIRCYRLSFANILILGHALEMTPKEFCAVFLNGYFREDELGHFSAYLEDADRFE